MNYLILLVNTVLGLLLLYSYYFLINKTENSQRLWGRIQKKYRPIYTVSMLLAALGYMLMMYFLVVKVKNNNELMREILVLQIIVILASMLWMPLTIRYMKNKNAIIKSIVILVLFTVAIASFGNFFKVSKIIVPKKEKYLKLISILGAFYLFFHTFVLDFLLWNYNFF